jgi:phosphoribosylaminoimidazolecarboxamide formyltransferase / IMP cyclohydrolase
MEQKVARAVVSVFDKEGLLPLARGLAELGIQILSSGGTGRVLRDAGVPVTQISDYTGFPELLDGRVKTLHPRIHGGILALRDKPEHQSDLDAHGIGPIDLVIVNLYPFEQTASIPGASFEEVVDMIDIGGPAMVRSAAKNHPHVGVVVDPADYAGVLAELRATRGLSYETRLRLAVKAFAHTAHYDTTVHAYLAKASPGRAVEVAPPFPEALQVELLKVQDLRYGENPHQRAAFYRDPLDKTPGIARAAQLQGKELSFNNILDFDGAQALVAEFKETACSIVKHGNPCGAALGRDPEDAFRRALECDPVSAFGGVIAFNRPVTGGAARAIAGAFYEGVIAPEFEPAALEALSARKNLRLLACGTLDHFGRRGYDLRRVTGGLLVQDWDAALESVRDARVATRRAPTEQEWISLEFAWAVVKHVKSNAIVYAAGGRTVGIGAGQMSRVDSARFGLQKARLAVRGAVMASDAFFPFRDGLDVAADAGITAVVQPGGSVRDAEVVAAAEEHEIAMVFTGHRHFRH